jgi:hypothetical protein
MHPHLAQGHGVTRRQAVFGNIPTLPSSIWPDHFSLRKVNCSKGQCNDRNSCFKRALARRVVKGLASARNFGFTFFAVKLTTSRATMYISVAAIAFFMATASAFAPTAFDPRNVLKKAPTSPALSMS